MARGETNIERRSPLAVDAEGRLVTRRATDERITGWHPLTADERARWAATIQRTHVLVGGHWVERFDEPRATTGLRSGIRNAFIIGAAALLIIAAAMYAGRL